MDLQVPAKRSKLENEEVSTGWFDLPFEMREMIIKKMNYKMRCVFAQCSKLCAEEVKRLNRFPLIIFLNRSVTKHPELYVSLDDDEYGCLYYLEFAQMACSDVPITEVIYFKATAANDDGKIEKWRGLENGDAEEVRVRYFDDYIDEYCENIYEIHINDGELPAWKYDMRKLRDIYRIYNDSGCDLLKSEVFDLSQITNAGKVLSSKTNVTFEQIVNLTGWHYNLKSDELNMTKIIRLLQIFQESKMDIEILELTLNLRMFPDAEMIENSLDGADVDDTYEHGRCLVINFNDSNGRYYECTLTQTYMMIGI